MENLMFLTMRRSRVEKRQLLVLNQCLPLSVAKGKPLALSFHPSPFTLHFAGGKPFTLYKTLTSASL